MLKELVLELLTKLILSVFDLICPIRIIKSFIAREEAVLLAVDVICPIRVIKLFIVLKVLVLLTRLVLLVVDVVIPTSQSCYPIMLSKKFTARYFLGAFISTLQNFWTKIRKRSKLQRNKFRRKGLQIPFREIYLAAGSFSPKMSSKILQSRVYPLITKEGFKRATMRAKLASCTAATTSSTFL